MAACYLLPSSKSADCRPFNTDSPHLNINDYLYTSPNLSDNVYIIECLNVFSELLGIFGGLIILAYQNCQIFTFSPPPPSKKRSTTCAYFGTKRSRYHILVAKGQEIITGCERFGYYILKRRHSGGKIHYCNTSLQCKGKYTVVQLVQLISGLPLEIT